MAKLSANYEVLYIIDPTLGEEETAALSGRRKRIVSGLLAIDKYEEALADQLRAGISQLPGAKVYGPPVGHPRTATVSFTISGIHSNKIARFLAERGIFVGRRFLRH